MITVTLPMPMNLANAEKNHWMRRKAKKAWLDAARPMLQEQVPRPALVGEYVYCWADIYGWSLMDWDNAAARLKWPLDLLVEYGLLIDDGPRYLAQPILRQGIDRKDQRVVIALSNDEVW